MEKIKNYLLGAAGVAILGILIAIITTGRAITQVLDATLVRNVNEPAVQPFHQGASPVLSGTGGPVLSGTAGGDDFNFTVPAGKRAVIEYGTINASIPTGQKFLEVRLDTVLNGVVRPHHFVLTSVATNVNGRDLYAASQQMRVYADPGTVVHVQVLRSAATGITNVFAEISGHFVDIVAPASQ